MGDKDDHQSFLAGLPDVSSPPAKPSPTATPAPSAPNPSMDDGALHLAATLTELKISNERLHADLAGRIRTLEAKVDAGLPDWKALTARLVQAAQEGGHKATERLVAANAETIKQAGHITDLRADDIHLFRAIVTWGAGPLYLFGLVAIMILGQITGSLKPIWWVAIAYLAGGLTVFQAYRIRDWWRAGAAQRAIRKQQKTR
jgi:outer membrane murein-binding lipoprotein Lpp